MQIAHNRLDLTGQRFGLLTAIAWGPKRGKESTWRCLCDCGTPVVVHTVNLRRGRTKSCGCQQFAGCTRHGLTTHTGRDAHPAYRSWQALVQRCLNPHNEAFPDYGGRGIQVCERWLDFVNFRDDMLPSWQPGLSIDRIDTNGDYCPENCRWATREQQNRNTRRSVWLQTPFGVLQQKDALVLWRDCDVNRFPRVPKPI